MKAAITATARYLPERVLTNADLEKMVETSDEWIRSRTGIETRHIVAEGQATSDMGVEVVNRILEKSGTRREEIDLLIMSTMTPDMCAPSTAALIQDKAGLINAWGFDLSAACSGFIFGLETGAGFIESGKYKKIIVIGGDAMSSILDFTDRNTCVLFGDGAGGVLMEPTGESGIIDSILHLDGNGGDALKIPASGSLNPASLDTIKKRMHYVWQDGKTVFKFAVKRMADVSEEILTRNNLSGSDIKLFIPHQANKRIIDATAKRCGLAPEKVLININRYGNTTAGTIPIGLDEAVEQNRLKKGDLLLLASFGAGFTWGSMLIKWGGSA
ncbi:MAG: beta-ketoacyl-ACP synthase III [Candidatus Neomarinimicrobiota bacterium]